VLRRLNLGETDRIVTLFTRERGKLRCVAKGARGPRSRLSGATEPFCVFEGLLSQGQNLDVLNQAEVRDAFLGIRKDLERVGYASHFAEVVNAGTEERQPLGELWDLLVAALTTLETARTPDVLCRAFELQAMRVLGYEPRLHECVVDEAEIDPAWIVFHPLRGGVLCRRCAARTPGSIRIGAPALGAMQLMMFQPLIRAAHSDLPSEVAGELQRALVPYVRHQLETNLNSLQYLDGIKP
jgi:DNA repair protein RecO (recombination protein O)